MKAKKVPETVPGFPQMLTVAEAALALNVARNTVFELIRLGEMGAPDGLRSVKLGKQVTRIPATELGALIDRRLGQPSIERPVREVKV